MESAIAEKNCLSADATELVTIPLEQYNKLYNKLKQAQAESIAERQKRTKLNEELNHAKQESQRLKSRLAAILVLCEQV